MLAVRVRAVAETRRTVTEHAAPPQKKPLRCYLPVRRLLLCHPEVGELRFQWSHGATIGWIKAASCGFDFLSPPFFCRSPFAAISFSSWPHSARRTKGALRLEQLQAVDAVRDAAIRDRFAEIAEVLGASLTRILAQGTLEWCAIWLQTDEGKDWSEGNPVDVSETRLSKPEAVWVPMNLFLSTRRLTDAKEDHLTEFLASALDVDEDFRRAYASTVLHSYAARNGWGPAEIKAITTQKSYPDARCIPDLVLTLADGHVIVCEHKLDSPETPGEAASAEEECAPVRQLERYLKLPGVHGVAYFRSWWQAPDECVLNHPLYIRPSSGREHFLWSDLYESLVRGRSLVTHWLRESFETLGSTPPHPSIGELEHPDEAVRARSRENLKKLWNPARTRLRRMGWKVEAGSICQLYLKNNAGSNAEMIYVSPCEPGGRILLVRVTLRDPGKVAEMAALLQSTAATAAVPSQVEPVDVSRAEGKRNVIDVKIPFNKLLDGATGVQEIEKKLSDHVCAIAERI